MPTQNVSPSNAGLLQEIADVMFKAKKVIVVTGAGISTNLGIPVSTELDLLPSTSLTNTCNLCLPMK